MLVAELDSGCCVSDVTYPCLLVCARAAGPLAFVAPVPPLPAAPSGWAPDRRPVAVFGVAVGPSGAKTPTVLRPAPGWQPPPAPEVVRRLDGGANVLPLLQAMEAAAGPIEAGRAAEDWLTRLRAGAAGAAGVRITPEQVEQMMLRCRDDWVRRGRCTRARAAQLLRMCVPAAACVRTQQNRMALCSRCFGADACRRAR